MKLSFFTLSCSFILARGAAINSKYQVFEGLSEIPVPWILKEGKNVDREQSFKLRIHLKNQNVALFEQKVLDISTPSHPSYGQHLDQVAIHGMLSPTEATYSLVADWLEVHGLSDNTSIERDWMIVNTTIGKVEHLLQTEYQIYENTETGKMTARTLKYSLPAVLHDHVDIIAPTIKFSTPSQQKSTVFKVSKTPDAKLSTTSSSSDVHDGLDVAACNTTITPDCLKALYKFKHFRASRRNGNELALAGFLEEYAQYDDLEQFLETYDSDAAGFNFTEILINGGLNTQDNVGGAQGIVEANLDIQYGLSIAYPTTTYYISTGGRPPETTDYEVDNEPYLEFLTALLAREKIPQTISISYGDGEWTVPESYALTVCNLFAQVAARGVSVLVSSGDGGSGGNCSKTDPSKLLYSPLFPAGCPWVTAVGATYHVLPEKAVSFSGGGFSNYFPRPAWQDATVSSYLQNYANSSQTQYYNTSGRGYPDVSAQGVDFHTIITGEDELVSGTSASSPAFAGIIALLNSDRISNNLPPFGFLNPWLYSKAGSSFTDIVNGKSSGCESQIPGAGFPATTGWDPVTGFGTPDFKKLRFLSTGIAS